LTSTFGDAAHADTADPDEVNGSDLARQSHEASLIVIFRLVRHCAGADDHFRS
jgi:hypothetical protein